MIEKLAKESHSRRMAGAISIDEIELRIDDQSRGPRCQVIVRIHDAARFAKLEQCFPDRVRWRRERRQAEHPAEATGQRYIWRLRTASEGYSQHSNGPTGGRAGSYLFEEMSSTYISSCLILSY